MPDRLSDVTIETGRTKSSPFQRRYITIQRLRRVRAAYPRQFWILIFALLINGIGGSMVWPFLTIYMRERLGVPLTVVTLLFSVNSLATLIAVSVVGPLVDRFGRKRAMLFGLILHSITLVAMSFTINLPIWAIIMVLQGVASPVYRVAVDAMVADLIEPQRRVDAYAALRMSSNLAITIGPAVGGFVSAFSYRLAFFVAAGANLFFVFLVIVAVQETLQRAAADAQATAAAGYGPVLRDRRFMAFSVITIIATMPAALMMMLLPVYAKENFGVAEAQYGFIMATNAAMVVLFQMAVSRVSQRYPALPVLTLGGILYAIGTGSVALGRGFWAFWLSMVVMTVGELLLVPTATALAANMAPADMRGRYMGVYSLGWGVASGIGPVIGGMLNDTIAPAATWLAGLGFGLLSAAGYAWMGLRRSASPGRRAGAEYAKSAE
ncbi:MAG: Multidrug resistance protein MdtH [Chloroflexi bacterium ADurb.Bin325]|nr:MAG: Multidrug resistance protein MdtH [Chloroflexi bacterium ADurb.Bin325]